MVIRTLWRSAVTEEIPLRSRGKWSQRGVPHKGWDCIGVTDLREEERSYITCQMCESQTIRFVHLMVHPHYEEVLQCGRDCAGHMEEDLRRSEMRHANIKKKAARRKGFADRKGWKYSAKGNPHITVEGYHCLVATRDGGFCIGIGMSNGGVKKIWGSRVYASRDVAKEACFDALQYMKSRPQQDRTHER